MKRYVLKLAKITFKYVISELLFAGSISRHYVKKIYNNDGGNGDDGDDKNDNNKMLMIIIMVIIVMLTLIIIIIIIGRFHPFRRPRRPLG